MAASNPLFPAYQPVNAAGQLIDGTLSRAPLGYQQLSAATLATSQALPSVPAATRYAIIQADTGAIRWRDDGTAPTATVGMLIAAGGELRYDGSFSALRLILSTAGAIANISYYG